MVHDPRLSVRPRGLAVRAGLGRQNGSKDKVGGLPARCPAVGCPPIGAATDLADWIDRLITSSNFKVKLRAPDISRISDLCDDLTSFYFLSSPHQQVLVMGVCRYPAMGMFYK